MEKKAKYFKIFQKNSQFWRHFMIQAKRFGNMRFNHLRPKIKLDLKVWALIVL